VIIHFNSVLHSVHTPVTTMPRLYVIVRFETSENIQPAYNTSDITITGVPVSLSENPTRLFSMYTVIDEEDPGGPWTYRVAVDIVKVANANVHISYGTISYSDALQRLQALPHQIRESDRDRVREEANVKAEISWSGDNRLKVKMRKGRFLWYELVVVDVENRANWKAPEEDADKGGDKKRRRVEEQKTIGSDLDIFDDDGMKMQ
jgi:hypothetical protein